MLRLTTRGTRSVAVRTPFTWSHCRWFAIDAEPPLPHENTPASLRIGLEEDRRRTVERVEVDVSQPGRSPPRRRRNTLPRLRTVRPGISPLLSAAGGAEAWRS